MVAHHLPPRLLLQIITPAQATEAASIFINSQQERVWDIIPLLFLLIQLWGVQWR